MLPRFPSIERLENISQQAGFVGFETAVPFEEVLQGEQYLNPEGPLSAAWRAGDCSWSLTTEEELAHALETVTSRLEDGSMAAFLEEREQLLAKNWADYLSGCPQTCLTIRRSACHAGTIADGCSVQASWLKRTIHQRVIRSIRSQFLPSSPRLRSHHNETTVRCLPVGNRA